MTATINWGDGNTTANVPIPQDPNGNCVVNGGDYTYADDGEYPVLATVYWSGFEVLALNTIAAITEDHNNALNSVAPLTLTEGVAFSGAVATFTDPGNTDPLSGFAATIGWGDGTTSAGTITEAGGTYTVTGNHTFTDEGSGNIDVTIWDGENRGQVGFIRLGDVTDSVTVNDADALAAAPVPDGTATAGTYFTGTVASFTDSYSQSASDFTATISWGDNSPPSVGTVTSSGGTLSVSGTHAYLAGGSYIAETTLTDDAPGSSSTVDTAVVNVADAVTAVSTSAVSGSAFKAGRSVPMTVTFTGPVTVTGTPQLALNDGGIATYLGGSGTPTLAFNYFVSASQNTNQLDYASPGALTGGTIVGSTTLIAASLLLPLPGAGDGLRAADLVIDTRPPTITTPPSGVTADATSPAGATVNYISQVGFTDLGGSGVKTSGCTPTSPSLFPIGTTQVNCTATDVAGNTATASFTVKVLGPADQAAILLGQVTPIGQSGLVNDVRQIQADIAKNHVNAACNDLADFLGLVQSQTGKTLTTAQANQFTGEATTIKNALGC
jgi:hypothetical protein